MELFIVERFYFSNFQIYPQFLWHFQLNEGHDGVVDNPLVFRINGIGNFLGLGFFQITNPLGFDVQLIRKGSRAQDPPGGSVITRFFQKNLLTFRHYGIKLC